MRNTLNGVLAKPIQERDHANNRIFYLIQKNSWN